MKPKVEPDLIIAKKLYREFFDVTRAFFSLNDTGNIGIDSFLVILCTAIGLLIKHISSSQPVSSNKKAIMELEAIMLRTITKIVKHYKIGEK